MALATYDLSIQLYGQDGDPLSGVIVSATLDRFDVDGGMVVPAAAVEDTTDATGAATLTLWPNVRGAFDSTYKIKGTDSTGAVVYFDVEADMPEYDTRLWDVAVVSNYDSLVNQINLIGSDDGEIRLKQTTYVLEADLTIPANINVVCPRGAILNQPSGITLTLYCTIDAGPYTIFSGDGAVQGLGHQRPEWHGATADGTTDDYAAFAKMDFTGSTSARQHIVELQNDKEYVLDTAWEITSSIWIVGNFARIRSPYGNTAIQIGTAGTRVNLPRITELGILQKTGASEVTTNGVTYIDEGTGLRLENVSHGHFEHLQIFNYQYGIYAGDTFGVDNDFHKCWIQGCEYGIYGSWGASPSNGFNTSMIEGGQVSQCKRGIEILGGTVLRLENISLQTLLERALVFQDCNELSLTNLYTEDIGTAGAGNTDVTVFMTDCNSVRIENCNFSALQGAWGGGFHPRYALDLNNVKAFTAEDSVFTYGRLAHVQVDVNCVDILFKNCRGTTNDSGEMLRISDSTLIKEARVEGVTQHYLGEKVSDYATQLVNYIPSACDLSTDWGATNATVTSGKFGPNSQLANAYQVEFTSAVATCKIEDTSPVVVGSQTKKLRLRFWAKLISIVTPVVNLPGFRVRISTVTPAQLVENVNFPVSSEWAFYDMEIDQFTESDGETAVTISGNTAIIVSLQNRLLGDLIRMSFWGIQLSRYDDFYYYPKPDRSGKIDEVLGGAILPNYIVAFGHAAIRTICAEDSPQTLSLSPPLGSTQWSVGDICFNTIVAVGLPKGWQCTVAGNPGTWVSMGNL